MPSHIFLEWKKWKLRKHGVYDCQFVRKIFSYGLINLNMMKPVRRDSHVVKISLMVNVKFGHSVTVTHVRALGIFD